MDYSLQIEEEKVSLLEEWKVAVYRKDMGNLYLSINRESPSLEEIWVIYMS